VDWDSSVGIATRYGLDDPGIEFWWRRDFPHPSRLALGLAVREMECLTLKMEALRYFET